jgi:hypothetical protein
MVTYLRGLRCDVILIMYNHYRGLKELLGYKWVRREVGTYARYDKCALHRF